MVNIEDIHEKVLAMVAWHERADGSDDVVVFIGIAQWADGKLTMHFDSPQSLFEVPDELLDRITPVPPEMRKDLREADYYFNVIIGDLSDEEDKTKLLSTGLKWPSRDAS
jgi:hypothetical protein